MHESNIPLDPTSMPQGVRHLVAMIQARRLTKEFFKTVEFRSAWDDVQACMVSDRGEDVWTALSVASRASSISKPAETIFLPAIKQRLSKILPEWHPLVDGEDRYYVAKALQSTSNNQIVDRAFVELAQEEVAEKARRVWANIAFVNSSSRQEFLIRLNQCVALAQREQNLTVDSLIRRLRRINNVIVDDLATSEKPTGSDYGDALRGFYAGRAIAKGPEDSALREESAVEFVRSLARIVRLSFAAASDPEVYGILAVLRRWWRPASPPRRFEALSKTVAEAGVETLHIFARQGVRNKLLREAIVAACSRNVVDRLAQAAADADVSLPEDVSYWLARGSERTGERSTAALEALSGTHLDERIGRLLIALSSPDSSFHALRTIADQVGILMPEEASVLSRMANRMSQIATWSNAVARSREMELTGAPGEIVTYDPAMHDANEDCVIGSKVVVASPGAVRKISGRPQVLIVKMEVRSL